MAVLLAELVMKLTPESTDVRCEVLSTVATITIPFDRIQYNTIEVSASFVFNVP